MNRLNKILLKRLEKIREELNSYIDSRLTITEHKSSTPISSRTPQEKKKDNVLDKFLNYMKLNDEDYDADYSDDEYSELEEVLARKKESFSEMLLRMIDEKGFKDSDVYKRAGIDRRLFSKIRCANDYVPSKKTAISLCLALQLEMDEAKKLLATAGYTLSASSRFDLIIMYLIEKCEYNIHFANIVLEDYGEGTLSR